MACRCDCWKDHDTGETFCTWLRTWVDTCPHEDYEPDGPEDDEESEQDE